MMNRRIIPLSFLLFILLSSFIMLPKISLKDLFKTISSEYGNLKQQTPKTKAVMDSWLYEEGVRSRYAIIKSIASLNHFKSVSELPVFLDGPHKNGTLHYYSINDFGAYNPAFLKEFEHEMKLFFKSRSNRLLAQKLYDLHLKQVVRSYYDAYQFLMPETDKEIPLLGQNYSELQEGLQKHITSMSTEDYYEVFRPYADQSTDDWYEAFVAPGFWLRRGLDGTERQMYTLLIMGMKQLDSDYLKK
jgi:hypothetical protein